MLVKVTISTKKGYDTIEGKVVSANYPWDLLLQRENKQGSYLDFTWFANIGTGITQIEAEGTVVYSNEKIPVPYVNYNPFIDEEMKKPCLIQFND